MSCKACRNARISTGFSRTPRTSPSSNRPEESSDCRAAASAAGSITNPGSVTVNSAILEGQVANRPIYLALGVTVNGEWDVLGLWAGEHSDGEAKYWLRVCSEIKNRCTRDVLMVVCDGLKVLPDAVNAVREKTIVQTCTAHLLRNSFKYASKRDWAQIAKDLKPVYTAASEAEALDRFAEFSGK